jgi:hypothetical protein
MAMIISGLRTLAVGALAFLWMTIASASATTLLNTLTEPFIGNGTNGYIMGSGGPVSIGVAFNSLASNKITEIEAFISTSTTAAVGMNFILLTDDSGLPGVQLFSKGFSLGVNSPGTAHVARLDHNAWNGVLVDRASFSGNDWRLGIQPISLWQQRSRFVFRLRYVSGRVAGGQNRWRIDGRRSRAIHLGDDAVRLRRHRLRRLSPQEAGGRRGLTGMNARATKAS